MMEMPKVINCTVSNCAYNTSQICHAMAITVGDISNRPKCDTFFQTTSHGGLKEVTAGVGACKIADCSYNSELECNARDIKVGMKSGSAECLTFKQSITIQLIRSRNLSGESPECSIADHSPKNILSNGKQLQQELT